jgi:predicted RNA-binding protein YlqC (UPF0109 family)
MTTVTEEFAPLHHADLLEEVARALIGDDGNQESLEVFEKKADPNTTIFVIRAAKSDRGKIIGKGGAAISHIRGLFDRIVAKENHRFYIEVEDEKNATSTRRRSPRRAA